MPFQGLPPTQAPPCQHTHTHEKTWHTFSSEWPEFFLATGFRSCHLFLATFRPLPPSAYPSRHTLFTLQGFPVSVCVETSAAKYAIYFWFRLETFAADFGISSPSKIPFFLGGEMCQGRSPGFATLNTKTVWL